jgi:hypothetical protein
MWGLLTVALPALPLAAAGITAAVGWRPATAWLTPAAAAGVVAAGIALAVRVLDHGPVTALGELVRVDALSAFMVVVIGVVALIATTYGVAYIDPELEDHDTTPGRARIYGVLVGGFVAAMLAAVVANNLGVVWVAVEATTIAIAFLVGHRRTRASLEASWKYMIIGSVGDAAARAVRLATIAANPTLLAYASAARAATLIATQPDKALAQLEDARRRAERVRNRWLLDVIILNGLANARLATGLLDDALTAYLEDAERTHTTGWTIHAWHPIWSAVTTLFRLGRPEEAALLLGGCEASKTSPFAYQVFLPELEALTRDEGEPHLLALRALGSALSLPELIRVAHGEQDVPSA